MVEAGTKAEDEEEGEEERDDVDITYNFKNVEEHVACIIILDNFSI